MKFQNLSTCSRGSPAAIVMVMTNMNVSAKISRALTACVDEHARKQMKLKLAAKLMPGCLVALCAAFTGSARADSTPPAYPVLDHVGFIVKDADKAVQDTAAMFDLADADSDCLIGHVTGRYNGQDIRYMGKFCMVDIGDKKLEFIEPLGSDPSPYLDTLRATGDTMHHVAFMVPSIDARLEQDRQHKPALHVVQDARLQEIGRYVYVAGILPGTLVEYAELPSQ